MKAHLRIARPTDNLEPLLPFYQQGLGFEVLGSFTDHDGFDGLMLGHPGGSTTSSSRGNLGIPQAELKRTKIFLFSICPTRQTGCKRSSG